MQCDDNLGAELEWLSNFVEESFSCAGDGAAALVAVSSVSAAVSSVSAAVSSPTSVLPSEQPQRMGENNCNSTASSSFCTDHNHLTNKNNNKNNNNNSYVQSTRRRRGRERIRRSLTSFSPSGCGSRANKRSRRTDVCFWNTMILSITEDFRIINSSSDTNKGEGAIHTSSGERMKELGLGLGLGDSESEFSETSQEEEEEDDDGGDEEEEEEEEGDEDEDEDEDEVKYSDKS